jgi:hypothetical protein
VHNTQVNGGPVYSVVISTAALSTGSAFDIAVLSADSSARCEVAAISLVLPSTQYTSGPALSIQILKGTTSTGNGAALTPRPLSKPWSGAPTAAFIANGVSSAQASTASATLIWAGAFDSRGRFDFLPRDRDSRIVLGLGMRLTVRLGGVPQIPAVVTGSLLIAEVGKSLPT